MPVSVARLAKTAAYVIYLLVLLCLTWLMFRSVQFYNTLTTSQRGWDGHVFAADAELGFAPIPGSSGSEILSTGQRIAAAFDEYGCRTNGRSPKPLSKPVVLFLGCSFTYGAACNVNETFASRVGSQMGTGINAGVPSYGLAPMLLRGQHLIPLIKPDVVIVQFSPWLIDRSVQYYAPSYLGLVPMPYFTSRNHDIAIAQPVFETILFELPIARYRNADASVSRFIDFTLDAGLPMAWHDTRSVLWTKLKSVAEITLPPSQDTSRIVGYVYGQLDSLTRRNGGKMIVINLNANQGNPGSFHPALDAFEKINVDSALWAQIPHPSYDSYLKKYGHWRKDILIDKHPNSMAHEIIANEILVYLRKQSLKEAAENE